MITSVFSALPVPVLVLINGGYRWPTGLAGQPPYTNFTRTSVVHLALMLGGSLQHAIFISKTLSTIFPYNLLLHSFPWRQLAVSNHSDLSMDDGVAPNNWTTIVIVIAKRSREHP
jgi:hypothetical protein